MNDATQPIAPEATDAAEEIPEVKILEPDFALKKKIGEKINIADIFTPERIAEAQQAIDDTQAEFLLWAEKDLAELDRAYKDFAVDPEGAFYELDRIRKIAFSVKCQAGTFSFALASEVAKSLYNYTMKHDKGYTPERLSVLQKHIEAIRTIITKNIQGEGGPIGAELKDSLEKLVSKFG